MQNALSVDDFVVLLERFAANAVPTRVRLLVEIVGRVFENQLDEVLDARLVRGISGAHELIVGDAEQRPDLFRALGDSVNQLLWRDFSLSGSLRDLLSVLVHSDEEVDVVAFQPVVTGNRVGADFLERVTLMGISGRVVDCGGEKVFGQLLSAPAPAPAAAAAPILAVVSTIAVVAAVPAGAAI